MAKPKNGLLPSSGRDILRRSLYYFFLIVVMPPALCSAPGCKTTSEYRLEADRAARGIIREKEREVFDRDREFNLERPVDILRRRLLLEQDLPMAGRASLGTDQLDAIPHWPEKGCPGTGPSSKKIVETKPGQPVTLNLNQALQAGALNSPEYQTYKEEIFKAALDLDLRRHDFDLTVTGEAESSYMIDKKDAGEELEGFENSGSLNLSRTLRNGIKLSAALTVDLVKLLTRGRISASGLSGDASISIPLLRGAGRHIVTEPLTQAERNVVYAMYDFERFKKILAVNIAEGYLGVLEQLGQADNAAENYKNLRASARRTRALADAGRTTEIEVDRVVQEELKARERWITALKSSQERLDDLKKLLGLPLDAAIRLERAELARLKTSLSEVPGDGTNKNESGKTEDVIDLKIDPENPEVNRTDAGPFEMDETRAIRIGLLNRLDLRHSEGRVFDAQRDVVVQADGLRAELTLLGEAGLGESRSLYTADEGDAELRTDRGIYTGLINLDLPLQRTAERNAYRSSYIALERAVRDFQEKEDEVKRDIRDSLREMARAGERLRIQNNALLLAQKRVKSTEMFFDAGRAELRDLLEAQEALLTAKNALTEAFVDYRVAELSFQRDTGSLRIDERGLIREYGSKKDDHGKEK